MNGMGFGMNGPNFPMGWNQMDYNQMMPMMNNGMGMMPFQNQLGKHLTLNHLAMLILRRNARSDGNVRNECEWDDSGNGHGNELWSRRGLRRELV